MRTQIIQERMFGLFHPKNLEQLRLCLALVWQYPAARVARSTSWLATPLRTPSGGFVALSSVKHLPQNSFPQHARVWNFSKYQRVYLQQGPGMTPWWLLCHQCALVNGLWISALEGVILEGSSSALGVLTVHYSCHYCVLQSSLYYLLASLLLFQPPATVNKPSY